MIKKITTTFMVGLLALFATNISFAQSEKDSEGWDALYKVFPKNVFPQRGRIRITKAPNERELLVKLENSGNKILETTAEPLALFYRGNLLFNLDRFEDAKTNNENLKRKFPKHGLCRQIFANKPSMVDQALMDIKSELDLRKSYKVVKLPHAVIDTTGKAIFHTSTGSFEIHCYTDAAPKTTANFKKLVKSGFYIGSSFHKLLSFRRMDVGCPNTKDKDKDEDTWGLGGPGYDLPMEYSDALHIGSTVSMRSTSNGMSHGSQFTICLHNQPELNNKQAVFGKLTGGLDVLRKLSQTKVGNNGRPTTRIEITGTQWIER
ncbi:MAG: cyclophilin family peptidyl-prolyl cis-trans isomerase [Planctomycetota bacterium]|jgi:cyclophilin family peptidyl-prolyl cis-trans isomerase